ncbi:cysteine synthase [Salpingoeca rosetta]|uniref:Cysteine synthase n=1 Tax=Salpingoeca rosetta (strain ATCC 50818 / BSB-021) TaxID=946362 RepID=F2U6K3_SALR5|nr:cysteine synthase [Salpingoeca rosetta]EGD83485.1 cysteine synthase [Salpingoeca rosetta]|eukprot:XP_004994989.1 cysteine synthase [Salpingoeca rosetta]
MLDARVVAGLVCASAVVSAGVAVVVMRWQAARASGLGSCEDNSRKGPKKAGEQPDDDDEREAQVRTGLEGLIGHTPLVELRSLSRITGCRILAKCEMLNPGGSSKDRVALGIILAAERDGLLRPGGTIYEGTAGSTGISLALLARGRGYRCVIVMPDDMAMEKEVMLRTLGADVRRVKAVSIVNRDHFCNVAKRMAEEDPMGFYANQFENIANARAHFATTGAELWQQTRGRLDAFVMAAGTGGTISGVAQYLRQRDPKIRVALVDPPGSSLYLKVVSGVTYTVEQAESRLQRNRYDTITEGIGIDRLTRNFDAGLPFITDAFKGTDQQAVDMAYFLLDNDGIFVGSSSAMNCVGAVRMAQRLGPGHTIVTCLCDQGHRSMSKLYSPEYLASRGLVTPQRGAAMPAFLTHAEDNADTRGGDARQ